MVNFEFDCETELDARQEWVQHILYLARQWVTMRWKKILLDFSLTVKAATLIFISGCGSAISSAKEEKSGFIHNLVKN